MLMFRNFNDVVYQGFSVSLRGSPLGRFQKLGVPYFGALIIRILLFRVLY